MLWPANVQGRNVKMRWKKIITLSKCTIPLHYVTHLMYSLQPKRGVGTYCVIKFICKKLTADMNPQKVLLSSWQVPGSIGTSGGQVQPYVSPCTVYWLVLAFKQFTVEEHSKVGDACQARDRFIAGCLQDFCGAGVLSLSLLVTVCMCGVQLGFMRWGKQVVKVSVLFLMRWDKPLFISFDRRAGQNRACGWGTLRVKAQNLGVPCHIVSYSPV